MKREAVSLASKGCKRCGSKTVAWHQSERGKWYLIEVFKDAHGNGVADYRDFHSHYCGNPEMHDSLQRSLDEEYARDADERDRRDVEREQDRLNDEAEKLRLFAELTPSARIDFIAAIQAKIDYENEHWISMDYFTDSMKQRREVESMRAEVDMYEDFNSDLADTEEV